MTARVASVRKGEKSFMKSGVYNASGGAAAKAFVLVAAAVSLSACIGSPTYGTGTPTDVQLLEDVTGVLTISPRNKEQIEYKPRPELVKPPSTNVLPPPQESVASTANPSWPESPEQRRARVRADATASRDELGFQPDVDGVAGSKPPPVVRNARGDTVDTSAPSAKSREEFNQRLAQKNQGSPDTRRYLSEPPVSYRVPAATAPVGDVGEDEWRKENRQQRATGNGWSWRDLIPGG